MSSFQKPSAVVAPVLVAIYILSRIPLKGSAHFLFTVGIVSGSVIKGHSCRIGFAKQSNGCFLGDPLDGQLPEGVQNSSSTVIPVSYKS